MLEDRERLRPGSDGNRVNATPGLYPIIATFLLTGGRKSEVLGLDVEDVSFDRALVPLPPQHPSRAEDAGQRSGRVALATTPRDPPTARIRACQRVGPTLPFRDGLGWLGTCGRVSTAMGALCGMEPGEVRTRAFRPHVLLDAFGDFASGSSGRG